MMLKLFYKASREFSRIILIGAQMTCSNNVMKKLHLMARCSSKIKTSTAWTKETLKLNYEERNKEAI
jgi:hypothetical protein